MTRPWSRWRALTLDALGNLRGRWSRFLLTAVGTVAGVGAVVAILGLADTARVQVSARFDAVRATEVLVVDAAPGDGGPAFDDRVDARLVQLDGVVHGGLLWTVDRAAATVTLPGGGARVLTVVAATPGAILATRPTFGQGTPFDDLLDRRGERVVLLGVAAAAELGLAPVALRPAVFVDGIPFTVIGVLTDVQRRPELLQAVIVPAGAARALWGQPEGHEVDATVIVETRPGAAVVVGQQAPLALRPHEPERLAASVPPDPRLLREQVDADLRNLVLMLSGVCLAIGMVGIANATVVSVLERVSEIGLRRALGARRRHVAAMVIIECAAVGTSGGVLGAWLGALAVVSIALARQWTAVLSPTLLALAPLLGAVTGVLAGLYPAARAARVNPVEALRR